MTKILLNTYARLLYDTVRVQNLALGIVLAPWPCFEDYVQDQAQQLSASANPPANEKELAQAILEQLYALADSQREECYTTTRASL